VKHDALEPGLGHRRDRGERITDVAHGDGAGFAQLANRRANRRHDLRVVDPLDAAAKRDQLLDPVREFDEKILPLVEVQFVDAALHDRAMRRLLRTDRRRVSLINSVSFEVMDGHGLKFARSSWDTVAISNSLHHFEDPRPVLDEMWRVLKPGGAFIVFEMYRDRQSPAQVTHVWLHHWAADLDRSQGIVHRHTYRRTDLVDLVRGLSLDPVRTAEISDTVADPKDEATMAWHESLIERQLDRAGGDRRLVRSGERVRQRLRDVGIQGATELLFVGRKPA